MSLTIGKYTVPYPLVQGGMGVRVSGARLASAVANAGGVGLMCVSSFIARSATFHFSLVDVIDRRSLVSLGRQDNHAHSVVTALFLQAPPICFGNQDASILDLSLKLYREHCSLSLHNPMQHHTTRIGG